MHNGVLSGWQMMNKMMLMADETVTGGPSTQNFHSYLSKAAAIMRMCGALGCIHITSLFNLKAIFSNRYQTDFF